MNKFKNQQIFLFVLSLLFFSACAHPPAMYYYKNVVDDPIASVEFDTETSVWFFEPFPGEILVWTIAKSPDLLPAAFKKEITPVELYETVAGKPAPIALINAYDRVLKKRRTQSEPRKARKLGQEEVGLPTEHQPPKNEFCPSPPQGADYSYCWLSRTNTAIVQAEGQHMKSSAYTYRGTIRHTYKYTYQNNTVTTHVILPEGWVSWVLMYSGSPCKREMSVDWADGNCYHSYFYGTGSTSSVTVPPFGPPACAIPTPR